MNDRPTHDQSSDEFEMLLAEAREMGMPGEIQPEDVGVQLPSAQEMLARAKDAEAVKAHSKPGSGARSMLARPAAVVAAAAAAAVILGVFVVGFSGRETAVADTPPVLDFEFARARDIAWAPGREARPRLLQLAEAASASKDSPGEGLTQYVLSENWFADITVDERRSSAALIPIRRESWLRADGAITVRESSGVPLRLDGRHDLGAAPSRRLKPVVESHPPKSLDANEVQRLGTDPGQVREAVLDATDCSSRKPSATRAACLVGWITTSAQNHVLSQQMLSAFWRLLADEPAMRDLGVVRDRAGRPGVGISLIAPDFKQFRRILIISPRTGKLLGYEEILIKADKELDLRAPAIYQFSAILESHLTTESGPHPPNTR